MRRFFLLTPIEKKPIVLPEILYDFAKWDIKPQYRDSLANLVRILEENETIVIELLSHTDMVGSNQSNLDLSQKRAQSVIDYLISRGIDSGRLKAIGYGENKPRKLTKDITRGVYTFKAGTTLTEDYIKAMPSMKKRAIANQLNRRTEFRVVSNDFVPDKKLVSTTPATATPPATIPDSAPVTTAASAVTAAPTPTPTPTPTVAPAPVTTSATSTSPTVKIPVYTVQVGAGNLSLSQFSELEDIRKCTGKDGIIRFVSGAFQSRDEAVEYVKQVKVKGFKDAWPVKVDENRKTCFK